MTVRLTGAQLKETLASQITTMESDAGQQYSAEMAMQVSGVRFEWVGHDGKQKIRDVRVDGKPLDPNASYEVAVNDFMAGGGSGYPLADKPIVQRTDKLLSTTVVDYLKSNGKIAPTTDGRIQRVDTSLADESVTLDGHGNAVMQFDAPDDYNGTVPNTFVVSTPDNRTVAAEKVIYDADEDTLTVRFDDTELASLVGCDETAQFDLYGGYRSSQYDRVYFNYSRLNADVTATLADRNGHGASERDATNENEDDSRATVPPMAAA